LICDSLSIGEWRLAIYSSDSTPRTDSELGGGSTLIRSAPTVITVAAALGLVVDGRIAQFANYHAFADQRMLLGIPHGADVLSNLGFAVVGLWGLSLWWGRFQFGDTKVASRHGTKRL
jgi:hypothetical protein